MKFTDIINKIIFSDANPITPQEIREVIKKDYTEFYGTQSHIRNVEKGHYKDKDQALLAQIYSAIRNDKHFFCDRNSKPIKISLRTNKVIKTTNKIEIRPERQKHLSPKVNAKQFEQKIEDILANYKSYHEAYYEIETFRGPSLYFHQRALETRQLANSITHLEYVYATLSSWGMHRMGKGGSKMKSFKVFSQSIEDLHSQIVEAQEYDFPEMNDHKWTLLKEIFNGIDVMASGTSLVGNSKVMHHMLPRIVPPIDREYTLWYLFGNKTIKNDLEGEWELMKKIISGFFIPVFSNREFESMAKGWITRKDEYPWDTSLMKIVDNLIIGSKKLLGS